MLRRSGPMLRRSLQRRMSMLAVECHKYAERSRDAVRVSHVSLPPSAPPPHKVLIDVLAAGADFVQILLHQGKYQVRAKPPFVLGAEVVGRVRAIGDATEPAAEPAAAGAAGGAAGGAPPAGKLAKLAVGDLVTASPSLSNYGGWAEQVEVERSSIVRLPPHMDPVDAPSRYSYCTSLHALQGRAKLQRGETLLVLGASGGVGSTAVELGKMMGAKVIAAASSDEKLAACRALGADLTINYEAEDLKHRLREMTDGRGVDVVYDPVGDRFAEPAARSLAWRGRYLVVGFAAGAIPKIALNLILFKEAMLMGSNLILFLESFISPPRHQILPYVAHPFSPYLRI